MITFLMLAGLAVCAGVVWKFYLMPQWTWMRRRVELAAECLELMQSESEPDLVRARVVRIVRTFAETDSCGFYEWDKEAGAYLLRSKEDPDELLPKAFTKEEAGEDIRFAELAENDGVLIMPLAERKAVIAAGRVRRPGAKLLEHAKYAAGLIGGIERKSKTPEESAAEVVKEVREEKGAIVSLQTAVANVSRIILDSEELMQWVPNVFMNVFHASSVFLLAKTEAAGQIPMSVGLRHDIMIRLLNDRKAEALFDGGNDVEVLRQGDAAFEKLPPYMHNAEMKVLLLYRTAYQGRQSLLFCCFASWPYVPNSVEESIAVQAMTRLLNNIGDMLKLQAAPQDQLRPADKMTLLKKMAEMVDGLRPYTVSHSRMMGRYAAIIARELGLPQQEVSEIALAAYLSNIGVLGLSNELLLKEGKYTAHETEQIRWHAEIGAQVVERIVAKTTVANMVRYHHERMDGTGYPKRMQGDAIPIGAKIISAVEQFLSGVEGRKYREPIPFDASMDMLRKLSGPKLDKTVVDAFAAWFDKKRSGARGDHRSLGPCWEMNCAPSSLCLTCPAYRDLSKPCWEQESNNCAGHGKTCTTCYVYTETLTKVDGRG